MPIKLIIPAFLAVVHYMLMIQQNHVKQFVQLALQHPIILINVNNNVITDNINKTKCAKLDALQDHSPII
jgi:hypothetical protein